MKGVISPKRAARYLAKAERRRSELEAEIADLDILIAGLRPLVPLPLATGEMTEEGASGTPPPAVPQEADSVGSSVPLDTAAATSWREYMDGTKAEESYSSEVIEQVGECDWAKGSHAHRVVDNEVTCLAPKSLWKQAEATT